MARNVVAYIAASWPRREYLRGIRIQLRALGIRVSSQWLDSVNAYDEGDFVAEAKRDYGDLDRADFVILDTTDMDTRGGRDWEAGYATGKGKRLIRVGPIITPFHAGIKLGFGGWASCVAHLASAIEHSDVRNN